MKKTAFLFIILASIFWGTSGLFVHFVAPFGFSSFQMTFIRSIIATLCIGIYLLIKDKTLFKTTKRELILFSLSGLSFFLTASFYFYSMQLTSVSTAVVLMYTAPVLVMIFSVAYLGEKFTKIKCISVILMIMGCVLVSGVIGGLKYNFLGILIGFLSGLAYSAYNIITKIQMKNNSHPLTAVFYCFLSATIIGFIVVKPYEIPVYILSNATFTIPLCIGMGICTCILPYFLYTFALKEIPAGTATTLGIIEPMAATLFSVIFLNEQLDIMSFTGIILILGAAFLLSKSKE